jgi:hypothetical protein
MDTYFDDVRAEYTAVAPDQVPVQSLTAAAVTSGCAVAMSVMVAAQYDALTHDTPANANEEMPAGRVTTEPVQCPADHTAW